MVITVPLGPEVGEIEQTLTTDVPGGHEGLGVGVGVGVGTGVEVGVETGLVFPTSIVQFTTPDCTGLLTPVFTTVIIQ